MARPNRTFLHSLRVLAWGLLAAASALAQLDPKLQASKTDFLDLYQQSTTDKAKPEILSIFDFSRSMSGLMTHPLFRNDDALAQDDESRTAAFGLSPVTTTTQYGFLATANNACSSRSYYSWITVQADRTATWSASANNISQCASDGQCFAFSIGCSSAATQSCAAGAYFVPESGFVATLTHPYPNMFLSSNAALNGNTATSTFSPGGSRPGRASQVSTCLTRSSMDEG